MNEAADRIGALEDGYTERKRDGTSGSELRRTIVAFANSVPEGRNGILYIGVTDKGRILGVDSPDSLQKTVRSQAEQECYPPIRVTSEVLTVDGRHVVAVIVPHSPSKPHFAGHAYVRRLGNGRGLAGSVRRARCIAQFKGGCYLGAQGPETHGHRGPQGAW